MHDEEEARARDNPAAARELRYPGGFDDFFRIEYRPLVKALMFMEGACRADADDCVAHTMEKLLERWNLPDSDPCYLRHPRAYAMKAAKHHFRNERHRAKTVALEEVEPVPTADEPALTALADRQIVADILKCLTPAQCQVMYLISEGYTSPEIAEVLRKSPNNVRQIAYQARKRLRLLWEPTTTGSSQGEEEES